MQIKWTPEQEKAVFSEKCNCLVSAAAGSGKTQVLTGRIIHRVMQDQIDINRILVVTFTKAAAAEMRERISENLTKALLADPSNIHLQKQLTLISSADITTMDSFCLKLLRTYFVEAGIDASFRVAEPTEAKLLRAEAAASALEEMYSSENAEFLAFANCYSDLKDDTALESLAIRLYEFAASMPEPEAWLSEKTDIYDLCDEIEFSENPFAAVAFKNVIMEIEGLADLFENAAIDFSESEAYYQTFCADRSALLSLCKSGLTWDALKFSLDDFSWPKRTKKEENKELAEKAEAVRTKLKRRFASIEKTLLYDEETCRSIMRTAAPHVRALCELTKTFMRIYSQIKKEKNILDYNDLEHLSIILLSEKTADGIMPSAIARQLSEYYDEIYIDEYQDSNDVQELLFSLISGKFTDKPNMFMVGDMKQSIYGFRKTSPALFIQKNETYKETGPNKRISLSRNFRSRPEILNFVNFIFDKIMKPEIGGIAYTEREKLNPGASYPASSEKRVTLAVVDTEGNALKRLEEEAFLIAEQIKSALKTEVYDLKKAEYRKTQFRDICVIMRSAKDMAAPLQEICEAEGIPLYCDVGGGFFSKTEVTTFLSLLQSIDNPQNDIPLLAAMRAPFFAFDEEELAQIRLRDREKSFYHATLKTSKEISPLGQKCKRFLQKLKTWRRKAAFVPTDTLVLSLFEETGYLLYLDGLENGEVKRANLELLFEKAHRFEETSFRGLFHFLRYVELLTERSDDDGEAKIINEAENVVRLMSIHKSKGLEFPIVILAGAGKKFNQKSMQGDFLFHKDLGIGISCIEEKRRIRYETPLRTAIYYQKRKEERGEELRVLYVALTRAKERLIITAASDMEKFLKNIPTRFSCAEILNAESPLHLLYSCLKDTDEASVRIYKPFEKSEGTREKKAVPIALSPDMDICKKLSYAYPYPELKNIPSKISVSEFKRLKEETDSLSFPLFRSETLKKPKFLRMDGNIKGADFGSLMHYVMQNFPYREINTYKEIESYIDALYEKKILSAEQAKAVDIKKLYAFWNGEMGERIRKADRVYREMPFTQTVPASLLTNKAEHTEQKIVVQGIIDCFFFEGDKIVLLDYKTDAPAPDYILKNRYKIQLDCYAMALEQKFFSEISQKVIYLFSNNGIILVD